MSDVGLEVGEGQFVSMIGPNGSGKTTVFNCITGFMKPDDGRVWLDGRDITGQSPFAIARLGVVRTFQSVRLLSRLTVMENLLVSLQEHRSESAVGRFFRSPRTRASEASGRRRAVELLERVGLAERADEPAGSLSYGQRKIVSILIALMPSPRVVLLDEPTAAVNPTAILGIADLLRELSREGQTFLLIEHNMEFVMRLSEQVLVLDAGQVIARGEPSEVRRNPKVLAAYLGT